MKKLIAFALMLVLMASLAGCAKEINGINDFSRYSGMKQETDRIEVTFDNHSGAPFYFTIEDQADIEEIMSIIFSSAFEKIGKEINDGDNTSIRIIQGENEYSMHINHNKEGDYFFAFSTDKLQSKIIELAREAGAYEGVE